MDAIAHYWKSSRGRTGRGQKETPKSFSLARVGRTEGHRNNGAGRRGPRNTSAPALSFPPPIVRDIRVTFRHQVLFTHNAFCISNLLVRNLLATGRHSRPQKVLIVLDHGLATARPDLPQTICEYFTAHGNVLELVCPPILLGGGERTKNSHPLLVRLETCIHRYNLDRHSYIVAIGGGALLDMVGLAAALAHRGLRHVRMPSTTLSQDDSGVGIKNGINAFGKKNFIGTFAPPYAVINDLAMLRSSSARDKRAGYAEAVKVALIRDAAFFDWLEREVDNLRAFNFQSMQRLIFRCAELHVDHIASSGDPFELRSARPPDFGHWSPHKLEQLSDYRVRHGEAVAIGLALDVLYSHYAGLLDDVSTQRILILLERLGFDLFVKELLQVDASGHLAILEGLEEFRQHLGGSLTISLLRGIGQETTVHTMKRVFIRKAIQELRRRHHRVSAQALNLGQ